MTRKIYNVIGTMSGTSFDGVDASFLKTDGKKVYCIGKSSYCKYPSVIKQKIANLVKNHHSVDLKTMLETSNQLTKIHANTIKKVLAKNNLKAKEVDLIGFHGQTIYHNHNKRLTLQIGNPYLLETLTKIRVISDFRNKNITKGGQGAPLAPIYHKILCSNIKKPVVFLNIGGVSNITYVGSDNKLIAFDTGPGNALLDDFILKKLRKPYDKSGTIASKGKIHERIVNDFIKQSPFFRKKPPKSLDRNEFASILKKFGHLSTKDALATLTFFTARSIFEATKFLPKPPIMWLACGGGRHNKFLLKILSTKLSLNIKLIDEVKLNNTYLDGDFIESQAFGVLAALVFSRKPIVY